MKNLNMTDASAQSYLIFIFAAVMSRTTWSKAFARSMIKINR